MNKKKIKLNYLLLKIIYKKQLKFFYISNRTFKISIMKERNTFR